MKPIKFTDEEVFDVVKFATNPHKMIHHRRQENGKEITEEDITNLRIELGVSEDVNAFCEKTT